MSKFCVAGLGNPGKKYELTRHNIGFLALDFLSRDQGNTDSRWKDNFGAQLQSWNLEGYEVIGVKPQRFMNRSGGPIQEVLNFYKIAPECLIVIHDEIDLPFGSLRLKRGGGDAGHNGLKSISQSIGTREYFRIRVGVGRPAHSEEERQIADWVLSAFYREEEQKLNKLLENVKGALLSLLLSGLEEAQREFHGKNVV